MKLKTTIELIHELNIQNLSIERFRGVNSLLKEEPSFPVILTQINKNYRILWEHGQTYRSIGYDYRLGNMSKIFKTGFRISCTTSDNYIFDLTGYQRGLTGRSNMATYSQVYLVTFEEAKQFSTLWSQIKEQKELFTKVQDLWTKHGKDLSIGQLSIINQIITNS